MKMVSRLILSLGAILALTQFAHADQDEGSLSKNAVMTVVETRFGFDGITEVNVSLTRVEAEAPYTGLTLQYGDQEKLLDIIETERDEEGCLIYTAQLPTVDEGERFHVFLTDHTSCETPRENGPIWIATVRHGYGWCGTEDAVMELEGTPYN